MASFVVDDIKIRARRNGRVGLNPNAVRDIDSSSNTVAFEDGMVFSVLCRSGASWLRETDKPTVELDTLKDRALDKQK